LDQKQKELKTVSVYGGLTGYTYPMARIIDIIGFQEKEKADIENYELKKKEKEEKEEKLKRWLYKLKPELEKDCKKR
jgi:hypothetical protein